MVTTWRASRGTPTTIRPNDRRRLAGRLPEFRELAPRLPEVRLSSLTVLDSTWKGEPCRGALSGLPSLTNQHIMTLRIMKDGPGNLAVPIFPRGSPSNLLQLFFSPFVADIAGV